MRNFSFKVATPAIVQTPIGGGNIGRFTFISNIFPIKRCYADIYQEKNLLRLKGEVSMSGRV
jgi:hypothetical protein